MSKVFNFYGGTITYKGDTDTYLQIYNTLIDEAGKAKSKYRKAYKDWGDVETFLDYGYGYGISLMEDIFLKFSDVFMAHRYYNFSIDLLKKHRLYHEVTNEFASAYFDVERRYEEIENVKRADEARREYRKNTRSRVIGGGFGIKGAVKGMAMAGAINMGTGLAHSTFNMIGNLFSSMSASSSKADLYDSSEDYICESLKQSIRDMMIIFDDLLKINVSFDQDMAEKIIKNIDDNIITGSQRIVALRDALKAYPFEEYIYYLVDKYYNDAEENVMPIAEYFGVPIKRYFRELRKVNGYAFESRILADKVRLHFDNLLKSVDGVVKKDILPKFFKADFLKDKKEKDALRFLLGYYYNLIDICPDNSAVLQYCNHNIDFFSKQLKELGESINVNVLKANDTGLVDLIIALYRHYYLKNKNYGLYCGNEITEKLRDEILDEFDLEESSIVYLVDKEGGYPYSYILYDKGLIVEKQFIDIEDLSFAKRNGTLKIHKDFMGSTIQVGGNEYSTVKSYDEILELFKCIEGMAHALLSRYYIRFLLNQSITNEQKNIIYHVLGSNYYLGQGLPQNNVKAFYWLIQAALNNYPNAQQTLGLIYTMDASFGLGAKKDLSKAKFWIQIAANNGYQPAIDALNQNEYELNKVKMATEREVYSGREYMLPLKKMNIVVAGINDTNPPKFEKEYYNPLKGVDVKPVHKTETTPVPATENKKEDKVQINTNANTVPSTQSEFVMPMFCAYCGKKLISGIQFCPYCGKKIMVMPEANGEEVPSVNGSEQENVTSYETNVQGDTEENYNVVNFADVAMDFEDEAIEEQTVSQATDVVQDNFTEELSDDEDFSDEFLFEGVYENIIEDKTNHQYPLKVDTKRFESFRTLNNRFLDSNSDMFMTWENIPEKKVKNVLNSYAKDKGIQAGDIRILFDNTVFGSAKEGFIITDEYIIGSKCKRPVPIRDIEYLSHDKGEQLLYAEPKHKCISEAMRLDTVSEGIERINESIFRFTEEDNDNSVAGTDYLEAANQNQDSLKVDIKRFEAFRDLNREYLDSNVGTFMIWENLSEKKAQNVLNSYAKDKGIQASDIKILYDYTLLGSAKEGFVMTDEYIIGSSNQRLIPLHQIKYLELDGQVHSIYAEPIHERLSVCTKNDFVMDGIDKINRSIFGLTQEDISQIRNTKNRGTTKILTPEIIDQGLISVRNSLSQEQIKGLDKVGERLYILDDIPEKKAKNAVNSYAKGLGIQPSDVKVLYDYTVFGNAKDGMIMTNQFIFDYENKQAIPINQTQYLEVVKLDKKERDVLAEPMHIRILHSIGNIEPDLLQLFIDRINQYVFNYPDELPVSQYVCPICGHLIKFNDASCNNCGTQLNWDNNSGTSGTQESSFKENEDAATSQQYVCPTCGQLINYKDAACVHCGTELVWE